MVMCLVLFGSIVCAIGTALTIKDVIKNRNILKGYPLLGSILTCVAVVFLNVGILVEQGNLLAFLFGILAIIFWLLVSLFLIKERIK